MPAPSHTPIRAKRGRVIHIADYHMPLTTVCGKPCQGWVVSLEHVDCVDCKAALIYPVKPQVRGRLVKRGTP